jgi:hypothetical protein
LLSIFQFWWDGSNRSWYCIPLLQKAGLLEPEPLSKYTFVQSHLTFHAAFGTEGEYSQVVLESGQAGLK